MAGLRGATPDSIERPFNNLLRRLSAGDFALIAPYLVHEEAGASELLYNPGDDVDIVHFPCGPSLATYLVSNEDGRDVETILVGAKAPSAELSARDICRPIRASWSSSAGHSCACMSESWTRRKQSRPRCATCSRATPTACWPRYSSR